MAIRFDATGDFLQRTANLPPIANFTIMLWGYLSSDTNAPQGFVRFGNDAGNSNFYSMRTTNNGTTLQSNSVGTRVDGTDLSVATWYHLAMVVSGTGAGQKLIYLNGSLDITNTGSTGPVAEAMLIGADRDNGDRRLDGRAAAVKVFNTALTASQIESEMHYYMPLHFANINSFYPLWTDTDRADYSHNGTAWTANGTLTTEDGPPIAWQRRRQRFYSFAAATGITGTLSKTLGALTSAATAELDIAGTTSTTLGALTSASTGTVDIVGTATPTLEALVSTSTGELDIAGTAAPTLDDMTSTATGELDIAGTATPTLDALTSASTGELDIAGTATPTLDALTSASTGELDIAGTTGATLEAVGVVSSGELALIGDVAATLDAVTLAAIGAGSKTGQLTVTLDPVTLVARETDGGTDTMDSLNRITHILTSLR